MRRLPWIAALLTSAQTAAAAEVVVKAGQYPDFIGLVLEFAERPAWSAARNDQGYVVTLETEAPVDLDLAGAVRILEAAPLAVAGAGNSIEIALGCRCAVEAANQGEAALVLDIYDLGGGGQPVVVEPAAEMAAPAEPQGAEIAAAPARDPRPNATTPTVAAPGPEPGGPPSPPPAVLPWDVSTTRTAAPSPGSADIRLAESLGEALRGGAQGHAVELLGRELSRAAAQGLIEAGTPGPRSADLGSAPVSLGENRANISVTNGLDREIIALRDEVPPTGDGSVCLPDSAVNVADWGDPSGLRDLGRIRGEAISEDGFVSREGALALARYYIALGFGAEARSSATAMAPGAARDLILALADIVDAGETGRGALAGQLSCDGMVSLWAALARPFGPSEVPASTDAMLSTFSALPAHLRTHLGPTLAERLRAAGLEDEARNAVNAVTRSGNQTGQSTLVTARLGLTGTEGDAARATLEELSRGTDVTAAEALLGLFEDAVDRGLPPNPKWVDDAPSLVRATVGTEVSEKLNVAGLQGRIALGQFEELREALAIEQAGVDDEMFRRLAADAVAAAAIQADAVDFLKTELGFAAAAPAALMARADRLAVAERLHAIGLPKRALIYLPDDPDGPDEAVVAAGILAAAGETERAIGLLSSRDESAALGTLGTVLSKAGRDADAIPVLEQGGLLEEAALGAMRIGDWGWIAERDAQVSPAARTLLGQDSHAGEDGGNAALIETSRDLREQARSLLETATVGEPAFTN